MTTILLIRHAHWDGVGRVLAGRNPGVGLSSKGISEAERLARALAELPIAAVYASPLERARETALPLARKLDLAVMDAAGLLELDYGRWTGRLIADLGSDPAWQRFNQEREAARIPGGETMAEAVTRAQAALAQISGSRADQLVAAVTHGDIIRGVLTDALGLPLERMFQLEVEPASVSVLVTGTPTVIPVINWRPDRLGGLRLERG